MRRPTLCCDNQPSADVDTPCKDQGGAFSRMRRLFLLKPLGRRSLASAGSKSPCRGTGSVVSRCDLSRGSASSSNTTSSSAPPLLLHQSFVSIEQEVLGMELEAAVMRSKSHQGIPALVYQLCSYILNHDVDSSALVFEEWCSRDVKDVLTRHPRCSSLDACNVAPLLRLFIERLPKPLISPATSAALVTIASDAASTQGRQLLLREVPASNLRLLRYLTAFLSCLRHSNRCEGGQAWVLLAAGVTGRCCAGDNRLLGKTVAEYLLLNNLSLFPEERLSLPPTLASDDLANSSDTSLTVLTSQEEEEEEQDSSGGGVVSSTNDDEDDRMSSSSSSTSSRSCTTTSEDTEGFRSPQLAMGEVSGRYRTMEESVSPDMDQLEQFSTGRGHEVSSCYPKADELTTTASSESQEPQKQSDAVTASDSLLSASDYANTDEPDEEQKGTTTSFDIETGRSTNSADHAILPPYFSCDSSPVAAIWDKALLARPLEESTSEAGVEESDSSAINNPSDQCNDLSSVGEVYLGGVSSEDAPVQDEGEPWLGEVHTDSSRRWSERFYPVRSSTTEYKSPEHRHHHKSKRRKSKSRRHSKEGSSVYGSSENSVAEKLEVPSRPLSGGEEDDDGEDDGAASSPVTDVEGPQRKDSLSSLLDHSEPAVPSDRGRYQAPPLDDHRTAMRYSRYADHDDVVSSSPWYKYDRPMSKDPLPSTMGGSNTSFSTAFIQAVAGKYSSGTPSHRNISAIKKRIKRFEEDFENKFGYKPSHSEKMKHKEIKKYMSDLSKARKELKIMKEGVADLVSSKGFSLSLLRCQESTALTHTASLDVASASSSGPDHASTLQKVEDRLRESRMSDDRPLELSKMSITQMQDEKTCLQKALLYYESVHGRPNTRDTRELARPLYDRYRQVKRSVSRAQLRAKENINELAPIIEHVAMDFTLASPQHRNSLTPEAQPTEQLLLCKEKLLAEQRRQTDVLRSPDSDDEDEEEQQGQEASLSDSSDVSKQSSALGNLHSLPLHELKERRREAKDQKKKLRKSLRQFEERYEREHGHKLAKENRGSMEQTYLDYKHAKAKLRLLEALISKKAPKEDEF